MSTDAEYCLCACTLCLSRRACIVAKGWVILLLAVQTCELSPGSGCVRREVALGTAPHGLGARLARRVDVVHNVRSAAW